MPWDTARARLHVALFSVRRLLQDVTVLVTQALALGQLTDDQSCPSSTITWLCTLAPVAIVPMWACTGVTVLGFHRLHSLFTGVDCPPFHILTDDHSTLKSTSTTAWACSPWSCPPLTCPRWIALYVLADHILGGKVSMWQWMVMVRDVCRVVNWGIQVGQKILELETAHRQIQGQFLPRC